MADHWQQLCDLIGQANGAKFRTFAQSLTLERLLLEANAQLAELSPRYRLERVPGTDLALQVVDLDMGTRCVRWTPSPVASFLVSLALALALSSLSSRQTQVESLFIDEGLAPSIRTVWIWRSPASTPSKPPVARSGSSPTSRRWWSGLACRSGSKPSAVASRVVVPEPSAQSPVPSAPAPRRK